jgi:hypothetical protein
VSIEIEKGEIDKHKDRNTIVTLKKARLRKMVGENICWVLEVDIVFLCFSLWCASFQGILLLHF